ncbi:MAG: hypothetical protein U0X20_21965 [Caldilineaceae bacterium]
MTTALQGNNAGVRPSVIDLAGRVVEYLPRTDLLTALEIRRRMRELRTLAREEGIELPMPAMWIAKLEMHGFVVDLQTGAFGHVLADSRDTAPTAEAWAMHNRGELPRWGGGE